MHRRGALLLSLALMAGAALADGANDPLRQRLEAAANPDATVRPPLLNAAAVLQFYLDRGFRPVWQGPDCSALVSELLAAIRDSESHGLDAETYHLDSLSRQARCDLDTELLATDAWLMLAEDLHAGRVDPTHLDPDWSMRRPDIDLNARLESALAGHDVGMPLLELAPHDPFYLSLQRALARFREYARRGGWRGVDDGPTLRAGDDGPRVAQLRSRLAASGMLDASLADSSAPFDATLEAAVEDFQRRANLEPDGIVGPMTLHQLNLCPEDRIAQLRVNLERWRWLPDDLGRRHVRVNIANFRLEAWSGGRIEQVHKVIVGKQYRRTPVFSDRIRYVVFNPWWETPRRLAVQDKLPMFSQDPSAIERLGFQILDAAGTPVDPATIDWAHVSARSFPYRVRQAPGPENALGQVKLMFPNAHNVYLHDTPTRGLFAKVRRDFSSGCIRVENALDLAEWVLRSTAGWGREHIRTVVASGETTTVALSEPVPVHILYLTVVPDADGDVRFVNDLYDRDRAVLTALDAATSRTTGSEPSVARR